MKKAMLFFVVLMFVCVLAACGEPVSAPDSAGAADAGTAGTAGTDGTNGTADAGDAQIGDTATGQGVYIKEEDQIYAFRSFSAQDIAGNAVDQSVFSGKTVTMINIWATFCTPCVKEMPDLNQLNLDYQAKGVQVIGIPGDLLQRDGSFSQDKLDLAMNIIDTTGADYLQILPSAGLQAAKLDFVQLFPQTVFVDEEGNQLGDAYLGAKNYQQWVEIIDQLLEEREGKDTL